ncbi:MAG: hypothetical protein ACYCOU_24895 [Sulfobacillus sp.]
MLHLIARHGELQDLFDEVLARGAKLSALPDADERYRHDLLVHCDSRYLSKLRDLGCAPSDELLPQLREQLCFGKVKRIISLSRLGFLSPESFRQLVGEHELDREILRRMLQQIQFIYDATGLKAPVDQVIKKYLSSLRLLYQNGVSPSGGVICDATKYYLLEVLQMPELRPRAGVGKECFRKLADLDNYLKASLRVLFNERRESEMSVLLAKS